MGTAIRSSEARRADSFFTGLVVNKKLALPRERRRWMRAVAHRLATGGEATVTPTQFAGWLAFRAMVEAQQTKA